MYSVLMTYHFPAVQVYASISSVAYLVNVGSESGGVRSLANITVRFLSLQRNF